jgi:hypothetical protein
VFELLFVMSRRLGCWSLPSMMYLMAPLTSARILWMASLAFAANWASSCICDV